MKKRVLSPVGQRRVRVGRKAIACGRMIGAIESRYAPAKKSRRRPDFFAYRPSRLHAIVLAALLIVSALGAGGYTVYQKHETDKRIAAEKVRLEKERIASKKAATCRENIAKSKADLVGKATYAELYGTSC
jgi:uncharacterized protein HemX